MSQPPRLFDRRLHRRRLQRAAPQFGRADYLKARVADDLTHRLATINRRFPIAVELGARTGVFARALASSAAADKIDLLVQTDLSETMLARVGGARAVADEARPPFGPASIDLFITALSLHWVDDLVGALVQIRLALKPDGLFIGALLGGATLAQLRACLTEAEIELTGGAGPRVSPFLDAVDGGALMQRAGFALPVVDVDRLEVRHDHLLDLMAELRAMGETNVLFDRPRTPLTRGVIARASELYHQRFGQDGRISSTFEVVTLTGWAPHASQPQPLAPGSATVRLADALGACEQSAGDKAGG
ncbi:MAG TPA: methyltransferase domain-containing protein [Caulobacteraceae bacterium]|jgi:SAM-dependent methyltransferase|nr:methyltransferase domain-containing protein [Caulobacteraceae bacterium]